jgi:hypothetical protein
MKAEIRKQGKAELVLGLQVIESEAVEVAEEDVAGDFVVATGFGEVLDIAEGLALRCIERGT